MHEASCEEISGPVEDPYCMDYAMMNGTSYTSIPKYVSITVA
jgi:hypothetical protein